MPVNETKHNSHFYTLGGKTHGAVDGAIRVPGIIKWPGIIKPGTVVEEMTSLMDIFPLVAEITEQPIPSDRIIDGKDIMPLILVGCSIVINDMIDLLLYQLRL